MSKDQMLLERRIKIPNINGLHARPATQFAEIANRFISEIFVSVKDKEKVNGKSIIDLLTLGAKKGTELIVSADGVDKEDALDALEGLVSDRFCEEMMEIRKGIAVAPGVVIKEAFLLESEGFRIPRHLITDDEVPEELARLTEAIKSAMDEINELEGNISRRVGAKIGTIFATHRLMLEDKKLRQEFVERIEKNKFSAEYSVSLSLRVYVRKFKEIEDPYLSARVSDIFDIEKRLLRNLLGEKREELKNLTREVIVVAHDLTPSQTASLDTSKVKGFVTDMGGRTSHSAIVARALGIPAVVGLGTATAEVFGGDLIVLDGNRGVVIIRPDEKTLKEYESIEKKFHIFEEKLVTELKDLPAVTPDGREIRILGNIDFPREISASLRHGASGIGLYRTEFLYLGSKSVPTEEEHFAAYKKSVEELKGKPIIIRTVDLGGDKISPTDKNTEANPFLGCRSIRYCLEHLSLFKLQLRAILRASALGNVKILFPLISTLQELRKAKDVVREVMDELKSAGIAFDEKIEIGIMIEVPSAVMLADVFAKEVDFFSFGTNDLIQYTLAIDRNNEKVAHLFSPAHPAIIRSLKHVITVADEHNIRVGICGEMGGQIEYTILLLGLGLKEFSVAPAMIIPEVKKIIRSVTFDRAKEIADTVCSFDDADKTTKYLRNIAREIIPEIF
ncbi:MAG: phosphoenolpyruvate--protein phosphotransferase [Candidatus Scalindua sp. AMX11]|nr:MAG: phosphoenolpyruvate--protein phosphotransferase [Candidatus Scalindua sp.]NOG84018.1 phosphoenolpyruvate--protein phosphotransferase [Planctomycetota bacterium]RZV88086.1 MAG: phosphoenolpyruvate--protein phosphotransferase [Candidatus Scalindua sp. SCAELEC01]TDE64019.1 MAG: phosphoenolpyruvate--protein phosphotransferase [Candidatus Scalindua sp. AMX11]GJQ60503.1 MAG: phosphoenolpyruvate-protein phosphotransferase [Candidatus Scalindua sp.]